MPGKEGRQVPIRSPRSTAPVERTAPKPGRGAGERSRPASALTDLLELLQSPACRLDAMGNIVHLNAAWRARAHPAGTKNTSVPLVQLIWPEDRHMALSHIRASAITGQKTDFPCRLADGGQAARWYLLSLQSVSDEAENEHGWLCIAADIHALKSREIDLERRASVQTDMLDISVDCIKLIALDGTVGHMNKAGCRALGVPENSSFGMAWLPLLPKDIWPAGEEALNVARKGVFARFPGRSVLPGQAVQYWDNMLTPVMGPNGQPTAVLCVSREVTAERAAQDALRQNQERLAIAAKIGGLGVWDYDVGNEKLYCDEAWYRIMARDPNQPIRSIEEFWPLVHPDDLGWLTDANQTIAELVATNCDHAVVFRITCPDGGVRWVRSGASVIKGETGMPVRVVGFVVDITDAQRRELELREAELALEEKKTAPVLHDAEDQSTGNSGSLLLQAAASASAPYHVRKAEEYMEANWNRLVPIEELVAVADVGVRTLFRSFNQFRGCSPMQFSRLVRLRRAREFLSTPTQETTVIGSALACGYSNASHFARHYFEAFGERPSQTLARHR